MVARGGTCTVAHQATELFSNSALSSQSDLWGQGTQKAEEMEE